MIPKYLKVPFYICWFVLVIYLVSKVTNSNSAEVEYAFVKADSVGSIGGDVPAIKELNKLVQENFLNRNYYETSSIETTSGYRMYANYNKKHQALFIGSADGWSYFFMPHLQS